MAKNKGFMINPVRDKALFPIPGQIGWPPGMINKTIEAATKRNQRSKGIFYSSILHDGRSQNAQNKKGLERGRG